MVAPAGVAMMIAVRHNADDPDDTQIKGNANTIITKGTNDNTERMPTQKVERTIHQFLCTEPNFQTTTQSKQSKNVFFFLFFKFKQSKGRILVLM